MTTDTIPVPPAINPRQGVVDWLVARLGAKAWDATTLAIVEDMQVQWCSRTGTAALQYGGGATDPAAINRASTNPDGQWQPGHDFIRLEDWAHRTGAWHTPGDGYEPQPGDALFVLRHTSTGLQLHYATVVGPGDSPGWLETIEGNSHYTDEHGKLVAPHGQIARGSQAYTYANVRGCVDVGQLLDQGIVPVEPVESLVA